MGMEHDVAEAIRRAVGAQGRFRWGKVSRIEATTGEPITVTVGDGADAPTMRAAEMGSPLVIGDWVIWWDEPGNSFVLNRLEVGA